MAVSDKERDAFIMECLNEGMSLSNLQKELVSRFDLHMTYMELRMLTAELQVNWEKQDAAAEAAKPKSKPDAKAAAPAQKENAAAEEDDATDEENATPAAASGKTTVEVSKLVRPGTSLSGSVNFGSGAKGEWYVDNMGRLGFEPAEGSSQPTQQDIQEFQMELRKALGY